MPRVSVIVAAYNHAKYLEECISSVLDQSFGDLEVVVVDNGSTDDTGEVLARITDPRLVRVRLEKNRGGVVGFKVAASHATGELIAPLTSDDAFEPEKLARQVEILDTDASCGAVFCHPRYVDEAGQPYVQPHKDATAYLVGNRDRPQWLRHLFYHGTCLCFPTALVRGELYRELTLDPRMRQLYDFDLLVQLALRTELHVITEPLVRLRIRDAMANESAARSDAIIRDFWERRKVLDRFTAVDPSTYESAFGESAGTDLTLALARRALAVNHPSYQLYGLDLWYDALGSDGDGDYPDLHRATGKYDPFKILNLPVDFEPERYLELNPDVRASGMDAGLHYALYGRGEHRPL